MSEQSPFAGVPASQTADYLLRTTQQVQMQHLLMADKKANMVITISSIIFSITLSQLDDEQFRLPLLVLASTSVVALILAVMTVYPKLSRTGVSSPHFNPLFFGHFTQLSASDYQQCIADILNDSERIYETITADIYGVGMVLATKKYRLLRLSYLVFLAGIVAASMTAVYTLL